MAKDEMKTQQAVPEAKSGMFGRFTVRAGAVLSGITGAASAVLGGLSAFAAVKYKDYRGTNAAWAGAATALSALAFVTTGATWKVAKDAKALDKLDGKSPQAAAPEHPAADKQEAMASNKREHAPDSARMDNKQEPQPNFAAREEARQGERSSLAR